MLFASALYPNSNYLFTCSSKSKLRRRGGQQAAVSEFPCASVSEQVQLRNHSLENEFSLRVHFHANQSHFFVLGLVLKQRHKGTQKWPIEKGKISTSLMNKEGDRFNRLITGHLAGLQSKGAITHKTCYGQLCLISP